MAVNRQKIWQINFNKYNAVGGGLKCCHPLNYKNTTVNQSPPHVGERGNFLWIAQKHTRKTSCILSTVSAKSSYAMPLSTHGGNGADGSKMRQPWKKEDYDLNALLFVKGEKSLLLKICLPCRNTEEEVLLQA